MHFCQLPVRQRKFTPLTVALLLLALSAPRARASFDGPTDPKAQKTWASLKAPGQHHPSQEWIDLYEKVDKQDGHRCGLCALEITNRSMKAGDYERARKAAMQLEGLATTPQDQAIAHSLHGAAALQLGLSKNKSTLLAEADEQYQKAIALDPDNSARAVLQDGIALANLHQDDAARSRFTQFLATGKPTPVLATRVERYVKQPELARERMAPAFQLTTLSGHKIELDDLEGKVLLVDFWATWCGPCRAALRRPATHRA